MKICSVPDYRGALIQVGAAVMALSWGGGRPGPCCCLLLLLLLMEDSRRRAWPLLLPLRGAGDAHVGAADTRDKGFTKTNTSWLVDCFKNSY